MDGPWLLCGDFNEIISNDEKRGGKRRSKHQLEQFRSVMDYCHLKDLSFSGSPFTWCNRRDNHHTISEKLDSFLANMYWLELLQLARVPNGYAASSDHLSIILLIDGVDKPKQCRKVFQFEAMWMESKDCNLIIINSWRNMSKQADMGLVMQKIEQCNRDIEKWNKTTFG